MPTTSRFSVKLATTMKRTHAPLRPTALFWVQFILRCIGMITSAISIGIAAFVAIKIHKTWVFVFASTILPLLLNTTEVLALIARRSPKFFISRIHPYLLIPLDALSIGLLIWSFFSLVFDKWGKSKAVSTLGYVADPWVGVEMWGAVSIAVAHAALLVFDIVDCCARKKTMGTKERELEIGHPMPVRRPTGDSGRGYQVNDDEW